MSALCQDISRLLELPVPSAAQAELALAPLASGGLLYPWVRPRPPFSPRMRQRTVDLRAEKGIVGSLTTLLSKVSKEDMARLLSQPAFHQAASPWRKACCLEYLDALTAAHLELKSHRFGLPRACAALVASFVWKAPEKGKYLADFIASQNHKSKILCKSICRSRDGLCMWTRDEGRPCPFFHPPNEILVLARARAGDDLYAAVQAILREREEQGAAA